jgi:hypothetical protein
VKTEPSAADATVPRERWVHVGDVAGTETIVRRADTTFAPFDCIELHQDAQNAVYTEYQALELAVMLIAGVQRTWPVTDDRRFSTRGAIDLLRSWDPRTEVEF